VSLAFKRIKVYVRGVLILAVAGAIALVLFENRANDVAFWFFGLTDETKHVNVVVVVLCTTGTTMWASRVLAFVVRFVREARELRRLAAAEQTAKDQAQREAELAERERRLEEKLKQWTPDGEGPGV
jgi:hypothetical protein